MATQQACQRFATLAELLADPAACTFTDVDDGTVLEASLDMASDMLYLLSGGRITGVCTRTMRPTPDDPYQSRMSSLLSTETYPIVNYGVERGWMKRYNGVETIPLRGPNTEILEVVIDGIVLNPSEYGLMDRKFLFRRVGYWPSANDLTLDDSRVGTWSVTYRFGRPPDMITKQAVIEVAIELANEANGKRSGLPVGATQAFIQGVSVSVQERSQALRDGGSHLPKLARFLGIYAPNGAPRSGAWSPELRHGWNMTETEGPSGS